MRYICERCNKEIGETTGGCLYMKRGGEDSFFSFRLCANCTREFIGYVDAFADPCKEHHKLEKPHKIVSEDVLLKEAARQDVREFLVDYGINKETAYTISEAVRKGKISSKEWPSVMLTVLENASVPEWFIEGCKKIIYLSDRNNYSTPCLVGDEEFEKAGCDIIQSISFEITEWEAQPADTE